MTAKKPGDIGYCGTDAKNDDSEAPTIHSNSSNWGFCASHCRLKKGQLEMFSTLYVCSTKFLLPFLKFLEYSVQHFIVLM